MSSWFIWVLIVLFCIGGIEVTYCFYAIQFLGELDGLIEERIKLALCVWKIRKLEVKDLRKCRVILVSCMREIEFLPELRKFHTMFH